MQLKHIGEFKLIDLIASQAGKSPPSVIKAIGDDAAVIETGSAGCLLVTTDILNEGLHFTLQHTTPYLLGKKCLAVNLSDIAAMGGTPLYYLVSLSVPADTPCGFVTKLYRGMQSRARQFGAFLLGGDTTASRSGLSVAITLLGRAHRRRIIYRHGAAPGDLVYVTGCLGDAALGLMLLKQPRRCSGGHALIKKHNDPSPRIQEGLCLSQAGLASSMIDISDGLLGDLLHILQHSRVGAEIRLADLPLSTQYRRHCPGLSADFFQPALHGGEDYELLFTVHPRNRSGVERLAAAMETPVTCIGKITGTPRKLVVLDRQGVPVRMKAGGFRHF